VRVRYHSFGVLLALAGAVPLAGCTGTDYDTQQAWFTKPFQFVSKNGGYTFSELQETKRTQRPITASDLVDNNGACPPQPAQQPPQPPPGAPGNAAANAPQPAPAVDPASLIGGGIGLGMTECDVVQRAGQPASVQLGNTPNGNRTAVLTYNGGPHPGIYRFAGGYLAEMDAVAVSAPTPAPPKKKSAKTPKKNDQG
jgi:hypothetical protein